jgi:hypothetical protein
MAHDTDPCKVEAGGNARGPIRRCVDFFDTHPRTGWYIAFMATVNVILNLLDALDVW